MNAGRKGIDAEPPSQGVTRLMEIAREEGLDTVHVLELYRNKFTEALAPKEQAFENLKQTILKMLPIELSSQGILHFDANDYWPDLPTHPETQDSDLKKRVLSDPQVHEAIQKALKIGWRNHAVERLCFFAMSEPTKIDEALRSLFDRAVKAGLNPEDARKSTQGREVFAKFLPLIFTNPSIQARVKNMLQSNLSVTELIDSIGSLKEAYEMELPEGISYDRFLGYIASIDNRETPALIAQIDEALSLLEVFEIQSNEAAIPDRTRVLKALASLTLDEWAVISELKEPVLLIVPFVRAERFQKAINREDVTNSVDGSHDSIFPELAKAAFPLNSAITGYQLVVTDGAVDVTSQKDVWNRGANITNSARIEAFKAEFNAKGVNLLNVPPYALLMLQAMKKGKPLDLQTRTLLNHIEFGRLIYGYYRHGQTQFTEAVNLDHVLVDDARLRPTVTRNM
jgi:hypothetical protein